MRVVTLVTVMPALVVVASATVVLADGRVALVVGKPHVCAHRPAAEPAERHHGCRPRRCGGSGFEVTTELDTDRAPADRRATGVHAPGVRGRDVSLVSYAGHGIEMDGVNCLEPLDARLERDVDGCLETGVDRGARRCGW